jgi:hypothetical protein
MRKLRRRYGHLRACPAGSQVQALLFPRARFNLSQAEAWAAKHRWVHGDVDMKADFIHFRQADPSGFRRIRTVHFGGSGVMARVGWRKC